MQIEDRILPLYEHCRCCLIPFTDRDVHDEMSWTLLGLDGSKLLDMRQTNRLPLKIRIRNGVCDGAQKDLRCGFISIDDSDLIVRSLWLVCSRIGQIVISQSFFFELVTI